MKALVEQHVARVFGFALRIAKDRHTAEDITQETLLRAWRQRGQLRDERSLRVWMFQIAANLWRDQLRRRQLAPERAGRLENEMVASAVEPGRALELGEQSARAVAALDELPPRQRQVLYLAACEGLKTAEIAQVLGCSAAAAKMNLSLARKKMRELLAEPDVSAGALRTTNSTSDR